MDGLFKLKCNGIYWDVVFVYIQYQMCRIENGYGCFVQQVEFKVIFLGNVFFDEFCYIFIVFWVIVSCLVVWIIYLENW